MRGEKYTYNDFVHEREIEGIKYTIPKKPPKSTIDGYNKPKHLQKFTPIKVPLDLKMWPKEEREAFISEEWRRRKEGFWFMNNGFIEYLTGLHYFYISYWMFPIVENGVKKLGLPFFVDSDRDRFYHWQGCIEDTKCYGEIEITNRRNGKSYRGLCTNYEVISRTPESKSGIQSKNNRDGKDLFDKLVKSWQKLPYYWKPVDSGETHPASSLKFQEPSKRDSKNQRKVYTQVLRSEIEYGTAKEEEYDGEGITFYLGDEIGKTTEADVHRRWYIVKECLADGSTVTGKALLTSTVEEMTRKSLDSCQRLWDESDPLDKNELGQTASGLYRFFKPAYYGYRGEDVDGKPFIDEFGYSQWERARAYMEKKRTNLKGISLTSEKHKYPFTPQEAFIIDNDQSPFDTDRIYSQIDHNQSLSSSTVVPGNFIWVTKDKEVRWVPSEGGRWKVAWLPPVDLRNNVRVHGNNLIPINIDKMCSAVDPYDHKTTTDGRKSDAASYVRYKFDPMNPDNSKIFVSQYIARPPKPEMFYEDMIIQSFFYGTDILPETNKIGLVNYFRMRGYEKFLMARPEPTHTTHSKRQTEPGIPMTGDDARNALISAIETEIYDNVGYIEEEDRFAKCYFPELLMDWAKFDVNNWTPYDCTVASGLTLLAEKKYIRQKKEIKTDVPFFRTYSQRGNESREVEI